MRRLFGWLFLPFNNRTEYSPHAQTDRRANRELQPDRKTSRLKPHLDFAASGWQQYATQGMVYAQDRQLAVADKGVPAWIPQVGQHQAACRLNIEAKRDVVGRLADDFGFASARRGQLEGFFDERHALRIEIGGCKTLQTRARIAHDFNALGHEGARQPGSAPS